MPEDKKIEVSGPEIKDRLHLSKKDDSVNPPEPVKESVAKPAAKPAVDATSGSKEGSLSHRKVARRVNKVSAELDNLEALMGPPHLDFHKYADAMQRVRDAVEDVK